VSAAGKRRGDVFPPEWQRLERSAEEASSLLRQWIGRAREAEEEVERLRLSLEEVAERSTSEDAAQQLRRLKAENAALHSRMLQARNRVAGLMQRLAALEVEP
jgi:hypothetical protein